MLFQDRWEAGRLLAARLGHLRGEDVVVLGLPRGGVVVAKAVADVLGAPLDVLVVKKIGAPGNPEYALGAVTAAGTRVLQEDAPASSAWLEQETARQRQLAQARETDLRRLRPAESLAGKTVLVVDDGIATGMTMRAAVVELGQLGAARIVVAAPVASHDALEYLRRMAAEVVVLGTPSPFYAVGQFYIDFQQVTDADVRQLLSAQGRSRRPSPP